MQLKSVSVHSLFGRFDHNVPMNQEERVTIITAPNGYGKTTILSMIRDFFDGNYIGLTRYEYQYVEFRFNQEKIVRIDKGPSPDLFDDVNEQVRDSSLTITPVNLGEDIKPWQLNAMFAEMRRAQSLDKYAPWLDQVGSDGWYDGQTGETISTFDAIIRYRAYFPTSIRDIKKAPDWLREVVASVDCHLIDTRRLIMSNGKDVPRYARQIKQHESVVEQNADDLTTRIGRSLQDYANESQKLDQSFPERILSQLGEDPPSDDTLRSRLEMLEATRTNYMGAGLLDRFSSPPVRPDDLISDEDETVRNILSVYAEDMENKLFALESIYRKIEVFKSIVSSHFSFKELVVHSEQGFIVKDDRGSPVPLSELSSGEQHELVLMYDLLFRVPDNALILIDEPEISLHVAWQKNFISDIQRIQELRNLSVVIATHSPQIISGRFDLMIDLEYRDVF